MLRTLATFVLAICLCASCRGGSAATTAAPARTPAGPGSGPIVIGATLPLTGADAKPAAAFREGYEMAFAEANQGGGLELASGRKPVELKLLDDTGSPEKAAALLEQLIERDKVDLLLGTYQGTLVGPQAVVAEKHGIPYVNGGGATPAIYQSAPTWAFGLLSPIEMLAYSEMRWVDVQQNLGRLPAPARLAILWEKTQHGIDFRHGVLDFATRTPRRRAAYEVVFDESFELGAADVKGIMRRLQSANADVFLADTHLPDFIALHKEYVAARLCHPVVTYGARGSERQAAEALGRENVAYILSGVWWSADFAGQARNAPFVEGYLARYHRKPEWYAALAYESARALFTAIGNARSISHEKVRQELANLDMDSLVPGGRLAFQHGQAQYPFLVLQNRPDGTSPIVYPLELAQAPALVNPRCSKPGPARTAAR